MYRNICLLTLLLSVSSCDFINKKVFKKNDLVLTDTIVDFSKVTVYPIFPSCTTLIENEEIASCFIENMHSHFADAFYSITFEVPECTDEIITFHLLVDKKGKVSLYDVDQSDWATENLDIIEELVEEAISGLPDLEPATKKNVPVASVYEMPLVIKLD